ncbi:MAG: putative ORFan [Faunusvirus sp.]|jgi:hypothetical protein|uniref:Putative ORFan n=1 Tax=Faunusvirus sp. TaxID=2487766 RepID=A0A3G4ZY42_9VIRU|nr:MAG: putative ORFan [Faunusvirus sp.]
MKPIGNSADLSGYKSGFTTIHYIAIGSAEPLLYDGVIKNSDNQQFPPFLQLIRNEHPDKLIRVVLIDENINTYPYITKFLDSTWTELHSGLYFNKKYSVELVIYRTNSLIKYNVKQEFYTDESIALFKAYNDYVIKKNDYLFVHDFAGHRIDKLAYYFDHLYSDNKIYKTHIMYDISFRKNISCYIDLTDDANFPRIVGGNIYNPFNIPLSDMLNAYKTADKWQKQQIDIVIDQHINLLTDIWSFYRAVALKQFRMNPDEIVKNWDLYYKCNIGKQYDEYDKTGDINEFYSPINKLMKDYTINLITLFPINKLQCFQCTAHGYIHNRMRKIEWDLEWHRSSKRLYSIYTDIIYPNIISLRKQYFI